MDGLDVLYVERRHDQRVVGQRQQFAAVAAEDRQATHAAQAGRLECHGQIRRLPARADADEHVAVAPERLDLAREHVLDVVVIGHRRQEDAVGRERDGREGGALRILEPPDELGREVLGIGGALPVAAEQELAAVGERADHDLGRLHDPAAQRAPRRLDRLDRARKPPIDDGARPDPQRSIRVDGAQHVAVHVVERADHLLPGEEVIRAPMRLAAVLLAPLPLAQQGCHALGQGDGILGRHEEAGLAVADAELDAADVGADDRRAARHRLDRRQAERLVPGRGHERVGGAIEVLQLVPAAPPREGDSIGDPLSQRQELQSADLRGRLGVGQLGLAADDDEVAGLEAVDLEQPRERPDGRVDPLARDDPPDLQHDRLIRRQPEGDAGDPGVDRRKLFRIEAAGHDRDAAGRRVVEADQVVLILGALGDDVVRARDDAVLGLDPLLGREVGGALVELPHAAEPVERHDVGDTQRLLQGHRGQTGHPEVRVYQLVPPAAGDIEHELGELAHIGQQLFLGDRPVGTGGHVEHAHAGHPLDERRGVGVILAGEDVHLVAARRELLRDVADVDDLAPGIDAADRRERRGMLADEADALVHASSRPPPALVLLRLSQRRGVSSASPSPDRA